jgi:hypothetical protein
MPNNKMLTDEEQRAFNQDLTKGLALDYFYHFNNVPLHFIYRDGIIEGVLSDLEKRNKAITENLWLRGYNLYAVAELYFSFLYQKQALQMPLQSYLWTNVLREPRRDDKKRNYATFDEIQDGLEKWLSTEGWEKHEKWRQKPPNFEYRILLGAPDRTMRLVSIMPFGNQVLLEGIVTWTESGMLMETVFTAVLIYDMDGTISIDRSYMDGNNWPGSSAKWFHEFGFQKVNMDRGQIKGELNAIYDYYKSKIVPGELTDLEQRNQSIIEGTWLEAYNTASDQSIFHPERYRVQLPLQKISYNWERSKKIEKGIKEFVPDRSMQVILTYAKGNQVVAECIMSWTDEGIYRETPFIAFLLLDKDGLIIRDRRYIILDYWPGSDILKKM